MPALPAPHQSMGSGIPQWAWGIPSPERETDCDPDPGRYAASRRRLLAVRRKFNGAGVMSPDRPMARGPAPCMTDDLDEDETDAAQVLALRQTYWRNGYRPVPVYSGQKRPRGNGWLADALQDPPVWATRWP